jgi:hypothetical protein
MSLPCNTDRYGALEFSSMALGVIGVILLIAVAATIMVAIFTGSQWATAPLSVAVVALALLLVTWWTNIGIAGWSENWLGVALGSVVLIGGMIKLGIYVLIETD